MLPQIYQRNHMPHATHDSSTGAVAFSHPSMPQHAGRRSIQPSLPASAHAGRRSTPFPLLLELSLPLPKRCCSSLHCTVCTASLFTSHFRGSQQPRFCICTGTGACCGCVCLGTFERISQTCGGSSAFSFKSSIVLLHGMLSGTGWAMLVDGPAPHCTRRHHSAEATE